MASNNGQNPDSARASPESSRVRESTSSPEPLNPMDPVITDQSIFDAMHRLYSLDIGEDVSLPKLVVIGDQSSGKSSLLQSITGLEFPVSGGLTTRFATQMILRYRPNEEPFIRAFVSRSKVSSHRGQRDEILIHLRPQHSVDKKAFADFFRRAHECMALPALDANDAVDIRQNLAGRAVGRFSNDVLNIELSGPSQQNLILIDLPGFFHSTEGGKLTTEKDMVTEIANRYLRDDASTIITVMPASADSEGQVCFDIAKKHDENRSRTIGVTTKCDMVTSGTGSNALNFALKVGATEFLAWFAVRNRSPEDISNGATMEEAAAVEHSFFSKSTAWSSVAEDRRGIPALKKYLGTHLQAKIRKSMSSVLGRVRHRLREDTAELERLGSRRLTGMDQLRYLIPLCVDYGRLLEECLYGFHYSGSNSADSPLMARKHLQEVYDGFRQELKNQGHTWQFVTTRENITDAEQNAPDEDGGQEELDEDEEKEHNQSRFEPGDSDEDEDEDDEQDSDYNDGNTAQSHRSSSNDGFEEEDEEEEEEEGEGEGEDESVDCEPNNIIFEIRRQFRNTKGAAMPGTSDERLVMHLYRQQMAPWKAIAEKYVQRALDVVQGFVAAMLKTLKITTPVRNALLVHLEGPTRVMKARAFEELQKLIDDEDRPQGSRGHYHDQAFNNLRIDRSYRQIYIESQLNASKGQSRSLQAEAARQLDVSSETTAVTDTHDALYALYEASLERFVQNVIQIAIERCITAKDSMLLYFTPENISALPAEELSKIAGETAEVKRKRWELEEKIETFQKAENIIKQLQAGAPVVGADERALPLRQSQ